MPALQRPWSIQIELVEGCNRRCGFCGIQAIRSGVGNYKFMTLNDAEMIARRCALFCPNARYEFAMHGEPTMHPKLYEIMACFRHYLPGAQFMLTTNGRTMMANYGAMLLKLHKLFAYFDIIIMDTYEPERDKLWEYAWQVDEEDAFIKVYDFYGY